MSKSCTLCVYLILLISFDMTSISDAQLLQPILSMWSLDLDNNIITLNFSVQLNPTNNEMSIDCTAILIGPSAGNISMAIQLLPSVVGLQSNDATATCDLGMEFRSILNANPAVGTDPDNTYLYYDPSRAAGAPGNEPGTLLVGRANETFSETNGFQATQVLPDSTPPVIVNLHLDMNTGLMVFLFSQPVNISTWNFTDFHFQVTSNSTTAPIIVPLTGGEIINSVTGHSIIVLLTLSDLNALKLLVSQQTMNVTFNHTSALIEDFGGNSIALPHDNRLISIMYDLTNPSVISCDLDLLSNQLTLEIDEVIDVTSFLFSIITIQNSPNISISSITYTLEGGTVSTPSSSTTIVINLLLSDVENIRNFGEFSIYLSLPSATFVDLYGNHVNPIQGLLCAPTDDTVLPFQVFSTKKQLRRYLDGVSEAIYIPYAFPFGFQTHTLAYVGTNGVISFSRPFYYWYPYPFPGNYYLRRFYVVAPYWADHDIRRDGEVCYETFRRGSSTNENTLLDRVSHFIRINTMSDFSGAFMILAEWRDVHPYPHGSRYFYFFEKYYPSIRTFTNQENTYQALVITDGTESYAIFTYMCDLMRWSGLWRYPTIGYNAGGVLFANHPLTAREEANQIDCTINNSQYVNIVYKLSADPDVVKQLQAQCLSWYFSDIKSYGSSASISSFSDNQIACPCTARQAWRDRRFWYFTSKEDSFCFIERFRNSRGGAQECCYSRTRRFFNGALVLQGRSSGGLLRYHPWWSYTVNYPNYIEYDRNPQEICCLSAVGYCNLYHERRPPRSCVGYVPQRRTWGWGDPHITTIDGRRYTFNGLGEYVLLRENASNFEFQGRTQRAPDSAATLFSAFALREGDDTVEVSANLSTASFTVKFDGSDLSDSFTSVGNNVTISSTFIERSSNNSITVSFPSGVGVTINYTAGLLVYTLEVPLSFEGTTSGLLGNYNNDDSDEFVFRNGTMISNSSSDREIHQFGQSWQITDVDSIFAYEASEDVVTFSDPYHMPPFLDEILPSLMENSTLTNVCSNNIECLFDFAQTGDVEVGMAATTFENETAIETQEAFTFPPNITAPETFMATVGEESVYIFEVSSDSQNINVIILHEGEETLPSGVQLNNPDGDSYTITWTPADNTSVLNLTIVAMDPNLENISSFFNPVVQLCACENGRNCTTDSLLDTDFSFIILNCECPEGYDGQFCENDADGCDTISCLEGQQCFDYPAPLVGAECACPDGYASGNDSKCIDIDECANNSTIDCTQQCINIPGSYECDCYDGYRAITANATQCEDINECEGYNDCHQNCTNTEGSYYCSCDTGFELAADNRTCTAEVPCTTVTDCSQSCANISDRETCFCMPGYQLDIDGVTCSDIDECAKTPCDQTCTNTTGSFTCSCNSGYELDENGRSCNDIDECLSGPCPSDLICNNMDGNYSCDCPDGTMSNGTDCILVVITPTRLFTTPLLPTITQSPIPEKSDDGLATGTVVGIIVGVLLVAVVLIIAIGIFLGLYAKKKSSGPAKVTPKKITPAENSKHQLVKVKEAYD